MLRPLLRRGPTNSPCQSPPEGRLCPHPTQGWLRCSRWKPMALSHEDSLFRVVSFTALGPSSLLPHPSRPPEQ